MTEEYLKEEGWFQWYHKDYWCNENMVRGGGDATKCGLSFKDACEMQNLWEEREEMKDKVEEMWRKGYSE